MPQLSPLPWLVFFLVSFVPLLWVMMVSEWVWSVVNFEGSVEFCLFKFKW